MISSSEGPQQSQMDDFVFREKSRYNIFLWVDLTVGKLGVSCMEADKGMSYNLRHALVISWVKT